MKADWWMRYKGRSREVAMVIAEDNQDVKSALRRMQAYAHSPDRPDLLLPGWERYLPFRKIIDTVHYAGKGESALLQLADVCTFVIKRRLMADKLKIGEGERFYATLRPAHYQPELKSLKPVALPP